MSKKVHRDAVEGDIIPGKEIITGRVFKQYGKLTTPDGSIEYFLERIKGTDDHIEVMDMDTAQTRKVSAALFEMFVKNPVTGEWALIEAGMLPTELDLYDPDGPQYHII